MTTVEYATPHNQLKHYCKQFFSVPSPHIDTLCHNGKLQEEVFSVESILTVYHKDKQDES
jgi:hypothetical protein